MKKILSLMRQAIQKYDMISEGDKILVAVSGGKDSMVMLEGLYLLKNFYPEKFDIGVICIDAGFDGSNFDVIKNFCSNKNIDCHIEKTVIKQVVFEKMKETNPCSLCSRMRRAALCNYAEENGYNKLSLGHNRDDANETFIMNLSGKGKLECFEPKTSYDDRAITIIRPMIFVPEGLIYSACRRNNIPVMKKICPVDGKTKRESTKQMIEFLSKNHPDFKDNIFSAIQSMEIFTSKEKEKNI
ncbi:MAG: tRNA 2-thiocytidine(32) synthetase TtcA [Clostridia bacterium]|nr:tRNA 2-thiocytidine(32) synthetase TtcA [Clostridia bacterium]